MKGGDTTTQNTTTGLPAYIEPHVQDLLTRAQSLSKLPYQTYQNPRLANFSGDTSQAFGDVRSIAAAGTPGVGQAEATASGIAGYQAGSIPNMDYAAYANPYIQNVLDVQKQRAGQTFQEQQAGRDASAVAAGAFGGDRRFVADSLAQRDLNQQLQGIEAEGLAGAFDRATGLFQQDETNRRLGRQLGLDAAGQQANFSQMGQDLGLQRAEALSGVGAKIQQRDQAGLDLAYQDFQNQQNWPAQQLSLYSQLISGTPVSPTSTITTTEPAPDFLSQLLGLAVGGAGIWDLLS